MMEEISGIEKCRYGNQEQKEVPVYTGPFRVPGVHDYLFAVQSIVKGFNLMYIYFVVKSAINCVGLYLGARLKF
jgi:hypothetical protein